MNPDRMLEMCQRGQWRVDVDLDWSVPPRPMSRDEEIAIVQYFTDMAGIELLAGALFDEQRKRVEDPTMKKIFSTFVADEKRHSEVAKRLARYYDVHHYRDYEMSPSLVAFTPHFVNAVRYLSAEVANAYITGGELILDVALLRSINDYVHDSMSQRAMDLVNRDESRHIAVDYHMAEYYASSEYQAWLEKRPPQPLAQRLKALWAFANVLYYAKPFFEDVFFTPMKTVDPSGRRLREAFKRFQLLATKPDIAERPFTKFMMGIRDVTLHPIGGSLFGGVMSRLAGVPPELMQQMYSDEEAERAQRMSFDELAQEALGAKALN
jgi:hypothetical protein